MWRIVHTHGINIKVKVKTFKGNLPIDENDKYSWPWNLIPSFIGSVLFPWDTSTKCLSWLVHCRAVVSTNAYISPLVLTFLSVVGKVSGAYLPMFTLHRTFCITYTYDQKHLAMCITFYLCWETQAHDLPPIVWRYV